MCRGSEDGLLHLHAHTMYTASLHIYEAGGRRAYAPQALHLQDSDSDIAMAEAQYAVGAALVACVPGHTHYTECQALGGTCK